jgi:hypothetical protein
MIKDFAASLKGLKRDGLVTVAAALEMKVAKSMRVDAIIAAIERRILERRGINQRASLMDQTPAPNVIPDHVRETGAEIPSPVSP